jgi:polar amino acid transport system permease protein
MDLPSFWNVYTLTFITEALATTVIIAVIGLSIGGGLGFALGLARHPQVNHFWLLRIVIIAFVEIGRRVPFLVLLFIVFFGLQIAGWDVSKVMSAIIAVVIRAAVYFSESVRSGVEAISQSQWDAAAALNLSQLQTLRLIVLPQAWGIIIGPATILFVQLLKSTSIVSQIGVIELTGAAKLLNVRGYSAALCFGTILVLYYLLALGISHAGRWLEARSRASRNQASRQPMVGAQE